jgi:hypothetical protein
LRENHTEAVRSFREALTMRNARTELRAWSPRDSRLPERLDQFAIHLFDKATDIEKGIALTESERQQATDRQYLLAKEVSEISLEIQPQPDASEFILAQSEQELKDYDSVLQRANRAIERIVSHSRDQSEGTTDYVRDLFNWRRLRSRALTKLAERLRVEGSKSSREEALKDLLLAEDDLKACDAFAIKKNSPQIPHAVERIRVDALLTRVETELDLERLKDARIHLNGARYAIQRFVSISKLIGRKEMIDSFQARFHAIESRLQAEASKASDGRAQAGQVTASQSPKAG